MAELHTNDDYNTMQYNSSQETQKSDTKHFDYFDLGPNDILSGPVESKFCIMMLCTSGEGDFEVNMANIHLEAGTRLMLGHALYIKNVRLSPDFKAMMMIVNNPFAFDILTGIPTEMLSFIAENPAVKVENKDEWQMLVNLMDNVRLYARHTDHSAVREIVGGNFRMMICIISEYEFTGTQGAGKANYTMADVYFKKFVDLLEEHIKTEHEVAFYAMKLNSTPKYLSEITKQKTNHKAKEVISHILSIKLKREMLYSGKSMKVIAYDYNFADQSSLGKFFRKMNGISPSTFKKQQGAASLG